MTDIYDEIIISSGGIKGISLFGALHQFSKSYNIDKIKYLTGCSIGSIICLLITIGYSIDEIVKIIFEINFNNFQECKILNLIETCGLDNGLKFTNLLKAMLMNKNINENITYKELYEITNKVFTVSVVNITKGITEYHNYQTVPNLSVVMSVRMSSNIPLLFSPIFYNGSYYIDGALLEPFPYFYHKNTKKIGFCLFDKYEFDFIKENNENVNFVSDISNSLSYTFELLRILHINYIKNLYKKIPKNVVYINFKLKHIQATDFHLSYEEKKKIYDYGMNKCDIFLKKKYKKYRERYLAKKYYFIWKEKANS